MCEDSAGDQQRSDARVRAEYDTAKSIAGVAGAEAQIGLQIVVGELNADVIDSQLLALRLNLRAVLASLREPALQVNCGKISGGFPLLRQIALQCANARAYARSQCWP